MWQAGSLGRRAWVAAAALSSIGLQAGRARGDEVTKWNEVGAIAAVTNAGRPPAATMLDLASVHVAMYDAVTAIDRRYRPFAVKLDAPAGASQEAAAATAAHRVLVTFYPSQFAFLDGHYAASLASIPDGEAKQQGIAVGEAAAIRFLWKRLDSGRD